MEKWNQEEMDADLWKAVLENHTAGVDALLWKGANPETSFYYGAYKSDIDAYRERQREAFPEARQDGDECILVGSKGVVPGGDFAPIHVAAAHGMTGVVMTLHRQGKSRGLDNDVDPLYLAALNGHAETTSRLLSTGDYDPLFVNRHDGNAVTAAAQSGDERTLAVVVGHVAREGRLNEMLFGDMEPSRLKSLAAAAMAEGFDPNGISDGSTALHKAARAWEGGAEEVAALKAFVMGGAIVDARDCDGNSPLHVAAAEGKTGMCSALLAEGADVLARNAEGKTPADVAEANRSESAELLRACQNGSQAESSGPEQKPAEQSKAAARRI